MIAVADTTPICYLILIGEIDLLPKLFDQVLVPTAVIGELLHEDAPDAVRGWAASLPPWLSVKENPVRSTTDVEKLQSANRRQFCLRNRSMPA
jgi:predicted nucleic acid-binding protein